MDETNKLNKIIKEFYELQAKYEQKLINEKARIRKNKKTKSDKVSEYRKYKHKCIKCGKAGKMNFKRYKNQLKVSCPNEDTPCDLYININVNLIENYYTYHKKIKKKMEDLKESIIKQKLDLLYNLEEDDVVLQEFERIKDDFIETKKQLKEIQETFDDKLKFNQQNDDTGENEKIYIQDELDKLIKQLNNNIAEFNETTGDKDMNYYITDILEVQNKIRQLRYYNGFKIVEDKKGKNGYQHIVYSKEISYENQEIVKEKGKVVEYLKPQVDSDVDSEDELSLMKRPKSLKIKIPTETPQVESDDEGASLEAYSVDPWKISESDQFRPTTPDYDPNAPPISPAYNPNSPPISPAYNPNSPPVSPAYIPGIQEVNLDDLQPEK